MRTCSSQISQDSINKVGLSYQQTANTCCHLSVLHKKL